MSAGRPLRFLATTLGCWAAVRVALLWPVAGPLPVIVGALTPPARAGRIAHAPPPAATPVRVVERWRAVAVRPIAARPERARPLTSPEADVASAGLSRSDWSLRESVPTSIAAEPTAIGFIPASAAQSAPSRLSGSIWTIVRGGGSAPFAGGRLGGSQAGARLTYALGGPRRVALAARVSSPLAGRGLEAGIGLDWRPTRLPVHLIAEQRFGLDGGPAGPAAFVVGGLDPTPVAAGFRLEGYGQAGVAAGAGVFADGALRLSRPAARVGGLRLDLGVGAWGGAQRGAARLDIGPGAAVVVPLADRRVRVAVDYRVRVAGGAAPGSGPVLSIGSDF